MADFEQELAELRQMVVDLNGDGVPDAVLYPGHANFDPMTEQQQEASRRAATGDGLSSAIAGMTGLPLINQGVNDMTGGYEEGNPLRIARGVGNAALGVAPWTSAGRAAMTAAPVTTAGAYTLLPTMDVSMPSAQAAEGMPPLPLQRDQTVDPPQAVPPPTPETAQPAWYETLGRQVNQNILQPAYRGVTGAVEEIGDMFSSSDYQPPSYEQWLQQNGQAEIAAAERSEQASREDIPGVNAATANAIRAREAQRAAQIRNSLQQRYQSEIAQGAEQHSAGQDRRFAERAPYLAGALQVGPQILAGAALSRANRLHGRDLRRRQQDIDSGQITDPAQLQRAQQELAGIQGQRPAVLPYLAGGIGTSSAAKVATDAFDAASLPEGGTAREDLYANYTTPEGLKRVATDAAIRGGAGVAASLAGAGIGRIRSGMTQPGNQAAVRSAAGLPNVDAMRVQNRALRDVSDLEREAGEIQTVRDLTNAAIRGHRNQGLKDMGLRPPPGPVAQLQTRPTRTGARGTELSGEGAGSQPSLTGQPGRPSAEGQQTGPDLQSNTGSRPSGPTTSNVRSSLTPNRKTKIREVFAANNGTISDAELRKAAPGVPMKTLQRYKKQQETIWKKIGAKTYKDAVPYLQSTAAIGGAGLGAAMGLGADYEM